jgi:hypothetical protein
MREGNPSIPFGLRVIQSEAMVDPAEDWSGVRSPSRARRRRLRGFMQNIRHYWKPKDGFVQLPNGDIVMHPVVYAAIRDKIGSAS